MCCKLLQRVAESKGPFYFLQQNQHIFFVARQVVLFAAMLPDKLDVFVARITVALYSEFSLLIGLPISF